MLLNVAIVFLKRFCLFEREREKDRQQENMPWDGRRKERSTTHWAWCTKRRHIPGTGTLAWPEGFSSSTNEDDLAVALLCLLPRHYHLVFPRIHLNTDLTNTEHNHQSTDILFPTRCCQGCGATFCPPKLSKWLSTHFYDKPAPFFLNEKCCAIGFPLFEVNTHMIRNSVFF